MTRQSRLFTLFFFNDTATTEIYTLSLHDALPIFARATIGVPTLIRPQSKTSLPVDSTSRPPTWIVTCAAVPKSTLCRHRRAGQDRKSTRLNSSHSQISYAVFCLKKKRENNEP